MSQPRVFNVLAKRGQLTTSSYSSKTLNSSTITKQAEELLKDMNVVLVNSLVEDGVYFFKNLTNAIAAVNNTSGDAKEIWVAHEEYTAQNVTFPDPQTDIHIYGLTASEVDISSKSLPAFTNSTWTFATNTTGKKYVITGVRVAKSSVNETITYNGGLVDFNNCYFGNGTGNSIKFSNVGNITANFFGCEFENKVDVSGSSTNNLVVKMSSCKLTGGLTWNITSTGTVTFTLLNNCVLRGNIIIAAATKGNFSAYDSDIADKITYDNTTGITTKITLVNVVVIVTSITDIIDIQNNPAGDGLLHTRFSVINSTIISNAASNYLKGGVNGTDSISASNLVATDTTNTSALTTTGGIAVPKAIVGVVNA